MQKKDRKRLIIEAINNLPKQERVVLTLYYYEEMTMKEIGATLDLSESRVSQMHSAIISRLREQLMNKLTIFIIRALMGAFFGSSFGQYICSCKTMD